MVTLMLPVGVLSRGVSLYMTLIYSEVHNAVWFKLFTVHDLFTKFYIHTFTTLEPVVIHDYLLRTLTKKPFNPFAAGGYFG